MIVKLDEWIVVVVGLADDVGLALAEKGGVKVVIPNGGQIICCNRAIIVCKFLQLFVSSLVYTVRSTQKMYTRDCAYSLGWEKMGVIIADNVALSLAGEGGAKVMLPDGGPIQ